MTEGEERQTNDVVELEFPDEEVVENAPGPGRRVTDYIVEHPEICLGLALAVGAAVGVVVKRK